MRTGVKTQAVSYPKRFEEPLSYQVNDECSPRRDNKPDSGAESWDII